MLAGRVSITTTEREIKMTYRTWTEVKAEVTAMRVHTGTFIGPMLRLEDCIHNIVHHGGSIRTCLRCGHSLVG